MKKSKKSNALNRAQLVLYFLIIIGTFFLVYKASGNIEYRWRWNKVPSYIVSYETEEFRARIAGTVIKEGNSVYIQRSNGSKQLVAENAALSVEEGTSVSQGEVVAFHKGLKAGPLANGLFITLKVSFISIILAIIIGVLVGLMRIGPVYLLRLISITYIEIVRGTPLLVQIFIAYFFFRNLFINIKFSIAGYTIIDFSSAMFWGVLALSLFTGAYIAEIFRAGIQSIPRGQTEAARSLGMNYFKTMTYIVIPQAFRRTLPPMAGQFISLIKDSSLVSVIAITDLTKAGREVISSTYSTFEVWFTVAAMYLILTAALSFLVNKLELRMSRSD